MLDEAQKALELDSSLPEAHAALALIAATYDYDWKEAERLYAHAMVDGAVSPWTRALYASYYLVPAGRFEEAAQQCELALNGDPLHLAIRTTFALCLDAAGRIAEADAQVRQTLDLNPNFGPAYLTDAANRASRGRFAEALALAETAYSLSSPTVHFAGPLAGLLARTGDQTRAQELLERFRSGPEYLANIGMLCSCLYSGDIEGTADWAEKVIEGRWPSICSTLSGGLAKDLRVSPRWPKLAKMMNLDERRHRALPWASALV
jgi:Tfp pilus assembly protein PilF